MYDDNKLLNVKANVVINRPGVQRTKICLVSVLWEKVTGFKVVLVDDPNTNTSLARC